MTAAVATRLSALPFALALALAPLAGPVVAAPGEPRDVELRIGSKVFTESVILGEIAAGLARSTGQRVRVRQGLGGTRLLWDGLLAGEIDVYPEYTGTLAQEILPNAHPPGAGPGQTWLRAALAARGIGVMGPLGFNDTYALGVKHDLARRLGLKTISDLRGHPELRFGFSSEFVSRGDGWPLVRARYGLAPESVKGLDHDLAYRGMATGAIEVTDLYATDPEIQRNGLAALIDDLGVFPRYDAVLLYRMEAERAAPAAFVALRRLAGRVDEATMAAMNAQVRFDRRSERDVAAAFLQTTFGVAPAAEGGPPSMAGSILHNGSRHLLLVGLSLLAAIIVAVPIGVLAARRPRLGQVLLGVTGIIQTIPSLALLVFMIPLLGIGPSPAVAALFLYSLLPIVRNTHAGLRNIAPSVRESAAALGLPAGAILRRIELPLASPLILAGIKSAAVINVGTATLGALVGAGGFGEPIFTGIRLDAVGLIMQGAIPSSLLALAVQGLFELIERGVVPRGLRLR